MSRVKPSSAPVTTNVFPASGPDGAAGARLGPDIVSPAAASASTMAACSSSRNQAETVSAITGPMPSTSAISSGVARRSASIDPNAPARSSAVMPPTCGIPSAKRTRSNGRDFDRSIEPTTFSADVAWNPSSGRRSSTASL